MTLTRRVYQRHHAYFADGVRLPGVTTILGLAPKGKALADWPANETARYAVNHWDELGTLPEGDRLARIQGGRWENRDKAARKGTLVHRLGEQQVAGLDVSEQVPEELAGHVASYSRFLDAFDPDPMAIELSVCNREVGYAGTADLVAHMRGQVWLLDLKTGRSGIYGEAAMQTCAYARAETYTTPGEDGREHPLAGLGIERCGALHIRGDGYDLYPLDTGREAWDFFTHLAWLYHHREVMEQLVGEVVDPLALV